MVECKYCDREFDSETEMHIHWGEEHKEELNSHDEEKVKKAERKKEEEEREKMSRRKKLAGQGLAIGGALIVAIVLGYQALTAGGGTPVKNVNATFSLADEPMLGNPDANVTVVEFGDFQCPACRKFYAQSFGRLKKNYIDTGKIKFYWKNFPLERIHPWSRPAAEAMECVYRQNESAFWNVKSRIFRRQELINTGNVEQKIINWAGSEGVNQERIRSCINSNAASGEVSQDITEGERNGVSRTPTIYVNGKKLPGFGYSVIRAAIERELE